MITIEIPQRTHIFKVASCVEKVHSVRFKLALSLSE